MNYKKLLLSALAFVSASSWAQNTGNYVNNAVLEVRVDYQRDQIGGSKRDSESGFKGKFLNFRLDGNITDNVTYSYRQRLNKSFGDGKFFDATDWLYLKWQATDKWAFSGGKEIVAIGTFEYDYAPIDVYQYTEFCNQIGCYQYGAGATYNLTSNDQLTAQVVESVFRNEDTDLYGYNLRWTGSHGAYKTIWSVNMLEYKPGAYINYIALGNKLSFNRGNITLDYMNRYAKVNGASFLGDFTLSTELRVFPTDNLTVFGKYSIDHNSDNNADCCVYEGTKQHHGLVGVECFPLKGRKDIRLHANVSHTWGKNGNSDGVLLDKQTNINVGVTWRPNLLNIRHK